MSFSARTSAVSPPGTPGGHTDLACQDIDKAEGADGGVCEVVDHPPLRLQLTGQLSEQKALSTTRFCHEFAEPIQFHTEDEPSQRLFESGMLKKSLLTGVSCEGVVREAKVFQ